MCEGYRAVQHFLLSPVGRVAFRAMDTRIGWRIMPNVYVAAMAYIHTRHCRASDCTFEDLLLDNANM